MQAPFHWQTRCGLSYVWWPISILYGAISSFRRSRITSVQLDVPVICVGNTVVGGAGKTPTVIALAEWLKSWGMNPHIISRGYKGHYAGTVQVDPAIHIAVEVGDEPLLLAQHAPCWVAKRRAHAARAALQAGADVIIMDDGLQNPSLTKDFTVLVVDGKHGFGNGFMMPAGPCREPVSRSMNNADAVLVVGEWTDERIRRYIPDGMPTYNGKLVPKKRDLKGKKLHPFAGIGHPDKFFETVREMGAEITLTSRFDDHHNYTQKDMDRLLLESQEHAAQLVTTQKDYVRLPESFQQHVLPIAVDLQIDNEEALQAQLKERITPGR